MIYTLGRVDIYEKYLSSDLNASKGKTGTVWRTLDEVKRYKNSHGNLTNFRIYGVEADWDNDTSIIEGEVWRSLKRAAKLVRI